MRICCVSSQGKIGIYGGSSDFVYSNLDYTAAIRIAEKWECSEITQNKSDGARNTSKTFMIRNAINKPLLYNEQAFELWEAGEKV